jgi:hypothetical protein
MIKIVNLCNHYDIKRELCSIHLFFVMALSFLERWD